MRKLIIWWFQEEFLVFQYLCFPEINASVITIVKELQYN